MLTSKILRSTLGGLLFVAGSGFAATTTTTFQVTATIQASCSVSASTLAFGTIPAGSSTNGTGNVQVTCTNGTTYDIALNQGMFATMQGLAAPNRVMNGGSGNPGANFNIPYQLYTTSDRTTVWLDGTGGTATVGGTGDSTAQNYPVYGTASPISTVRAGSYSDTITVTVTYN